VVQAFTVPARFHLKRVRQLVLRDEDRRGVDDEEPWSLSFLDRQGWLQEQFRRHWDGRAGADEVGAFLDRAVATGLVRVGVFSDRDRRDLEASVDQVADWAASLKAEGWAPGEPRIPSRTRWAGRPWAPETDERLFRGTEILIPRLLYAAQIPARTKIETALGVLQDPVPTATLATLNPAGDRARFTWGPDARATEGLAERAQACWLEAVRRPLPFYPDYLEALAARRQKQGEPWPRSAEESWRQAWKDAERGNRSSSLLGRDPYAALAFADEPGGEALAADLAPWWDELLLPLLEAWS